MRPQTEGAGTYWIAPGAHVIGAGALVTEGKEIPDGSLVMGAPAKVVRALSEEGLASLRKPAENYVRNWKRFEADLRIVE